MSTQQRLRTSVCVRTASRLHLGTLALRPTLSRWFGGVGVMVEDPGVEVLALPSSEFRVEGPLADRVREFAGRYLSSTGEPHPPPLRLVVRRAAPTHVGLGTGTQLGLAVARVLAEWINRTDVSAEELARRVGRGERSGIGVHGFDRGGLLVEGGRRARGQEGEGARGRASSHSPEHPTTIPPTFGALRETSPLIASHTLPDQWRWVLFIPEHGQGLHGAAERAALARLAGQVDDHASAELCRLVLLALLPSAVEGDFDTFSEALYEFGRRVGECFSAAQGGTYLNDDVAELVAVLRRSGTRGVGQTSWGPTVFALAPDPDRASQIARLSARDLPSRTYRVVVTATSKTGAHCSNE